MKIETYNKIKESVKQSYDIVAKDYDSLFRNELDEHDYDKELLDNFAIGFPSGSRICEMGCGPSAQVGRYLFKKDLSIDCIDISDKCIENAKTIEGRINYICADMTQTGLPDEHYSGIVCFYALFHIPKEYQKEAIREFYRLLKPNGKLLIVNHNGLINKTINNIWNHSNLKLFINFTGKKHMNKILKDEGFEINSLFLKESYYGFPKYRVIAIGRKST